MAGTTHSITVIEDDDEATISTASAPKARLPVDDDVRIIKNHFCVGKHLVEPTNGANNCCGMFALEISTDMQLGRPLTQPEFWEIMKCPEMQEFNAKRNYVDTDNFYDDQLAAILRIWGRSYCGLDNLQLGIILDRPNCAYIFGDDDKIFPIFPGGDVEGEHGSKTVWIHNDKAMDRHGFDLNHYSGITLLEEGSSDEKSRTEEASGTESGDGTEAEEKEESPGEDSSDTVEAESSKEMGDDMDTEDEDGSPWRVLPY